MNSRLHLAFARFAGVLVLLAGCQQDVESRRIAVPEMDPRTIGHDAIAMYDADHDSAIAGDELEHCPGLKRSLREIDLDEDGRVTAAELAARIRQYQQDNIGIIGFIGHVTLDDEPLIGADVTLAPEPFMGSSSDSAHATTDPGGDFRVKTAGLDKLIGARPGIYRIAISKKDEHGNETIPARYNAESTLGVELRDENAVAERGLELNLTSEDNNIEDGDRRSDHSADGDSAEGGGSPGGSDDDG